VHCPFPVFYFVLLGVGFGVPSFAHNDHLAQVGTLDLIGTKTSYNSASDITLTSSLTNYRNILVHVGYSTYYNVYYYNVNAIRNLSTGEIRAWAYINDNIKGGYILKYINDTKLNITPGLGSYSANVYIYGIK